MSHYGFEIVQTLIVDIEPDEHVKRAMNEINAGNIYYKYIYRMHFLFDIFIFVYLLSQIRIDCAYI